MPLRCTQLCDTRLLIYNALALVKAKRSQVGQSFAHNLRRSLGRLPLSWRSLMHLSTSGSQRVKAHSPAVLLLDEGVKDGSACEEPVMSRVDGVMRGEGLSQATPDPTP